MIGGNDLLAGETLEVDVTDFVKARVSDNWLGFRLQVADPSMVPDVPPVTGDPDQYRFGSIQDNDIRLVFDNPPPAVSLMAVGNTPVRVGDDWVVTLTVENTSAQSAASDVVVTLPDGGSLPAGATLDGGASSTTVGTLTGGGNVVWNVGQLPIGGDATATIVFNTSAVFRAMPSAVADSADAGSTTAMLGEALVTFRGDVTLDGTVDSADVATLGASFNTAGGSSDLNDDGHVDLDDLSLLIADLGGSI